MWPDPCLGRQVGERDHLPPRQPVSARKEDAQRIVEHRDELDLLGGRLGVVRGLEDDGDVEVPGSETAKGRRPIDELVGKRDVWVAGVETRTDLRREVHERREERAQADFTAAQPGKLGDLPLGQGRATQHRFPVLEKQTPGPRRHHSLPRTQDQLHAELTLEDADLA